MSRYTFIVPPFSGHINPTLSVGQQLIHRGHDVSWISAKAIVVPDGGTLIDLENTLHAKKQEMADLLASAKQGRNIATSIASVKFVYQDILIPLAKLMMEAVSQAIDQWGPDIVINDEHAFAGALAAYKKGIPYVTFRTVPADLQNVIYDKISSWISEQILQLQKDYGIHLSNEIVYSDQLMIIFSSKELTGTCDLPDHYRFVGPAMDPRPSDENIDFVEELEMGRPNILLSMGTIQRDDKVPFFTKVVEALANLPLTVVVIAEPDLLGSWPANFIVRSYVPQLRLLPHIDAVICHGGQNTVSESLYHGLPLIVLPMAFDQFHVASQVIKAGAGIRLKFKRLHSQTLKESVEEILKNPTYGMGAQHIAESFKKAGGSLKAADLIEEFSAKTIVLRKEDAELNKGPEFSNYQLNIKNNPV